MSEKLTKQQAVEVIKQILGAALESCDADVLNDLVSNIKKVKPRKRVLARSSQVFTPKSYAFLVGKSDTAENIAQILSGKDPKFAELYPDETVNTRGFWVRIDRKDSPISGWYRLRVLQGESTNALCDTFKLELAQFPYNKKKAPTIVYPPISGNPRKLRNTDQIKEASSIKNLMQESLLHTAPSPAIVFNLREKLPS